MFPQISKTQKILLAVFFFLMLLILARFFRYLSFPDVQHQFDRTSDTVMYPDKPVFQTFTAQKNNLDQIDVLIDNFHSWSLDAIVFELRDASCGRILAKDKLDIYSFSYTIFTPFSFSNIYDSELAGTKDKQYCAAFTYVPGKYSSPDPKNFPLLLHENDDTSSFTNTGENGGAGATHDKRSLVIKPAYSSHSLSANLRTLNDRLSQYKAGFLKGTGIYLLSFSSVLLSLALITILIIL